MLDFRVFMSQCHHVQLAQKEQLIIPFIARASIIYMFSNSYWHENSHSNREQLHNTKLLVLLEPAIQFII